MSVDIDMWSTDQATATSPLSARATPSNSPTAQTRTYPVRSSANIVHPDLTLPAALDPEVIRLDKWIPILCEIHH